MDLITVRAVGEMPELILEAAPLLKKGGKLVFYKGPSTTSEEIAFARKRAKKKRLNLRLEQAFTLPLQDAPKRILFIFERE